MTHTQAHAATTTMPRPLSQPMQNHQGTPSLIAGTAVVDVQPPERYSNPVQPAVQTSPIIPGMISSVQQVQTTNRHEITAPTLLQGPRCYVDSSTEPDLPNSQSRLAGLDVFILNFQEQPTQAITLRRNLKLARQ
jgi:hypothetical protein